MNLSQNAITNRSCGVGGDRARLTNSDRWFFIHLYQCFPSVLQVLTIIRPETLARWHRFGFRCCWLWKSRLGGGRPIHVVRCHAEFLRISRRSPVSANRAFSALVM
jgi:hypothetical protein